MVTLKQRALDLVYQLKKNSITVWLVHMEVVKAQKRV